MDVLSPNGKTRTIRKPWSVMAYQIAGDDGLKSVKEGLQLQ
jgi:hypothetical protein